MKKLGIDISSVSRLLRTIPKRENNFNPYCFKEQEKLQYKKNQTDYPEKASNQGFKDGIREFFKDLIYHKSKYLYTIARMILAKRGSELSIKINVIQPETIVNAAS